MIDQPVITLDCDWAPDFIIEDVAKILLNRNVKATWFVTNNSKCINGILDNSLFELGIHPNFQPNSTQGSNPNTILINLKKILPQAKSVRTHTLLQSSPLLSLFNKFGIENDVSILMEKTKNLTPFYSKFFKLFRFPYFWDDYLALSINNYWFKNDQLRKFPGLKIFNFHPIHIVLNSTNIQNYYEFKRKNILENIDENTIQEFLNNGYGVRSFFIDWVKYLENKETFTIQDLQSKFRKMIENE